MTGNTVELGIKPTLAPEQQTAVHPHDLGTIALATEDDPSLITLRPPSAVKSVDPIKVVPKPGFMGRMYYHARGQTLENGIVLNDGMMLACAAPKIAYEAIKREYKRRFKEPSWMPGTSDGQFVHEFFNLDPTSDRSAGEVREYMALPKEDINDYTLRIREKFILPVDELSEVDIEMPYDRSVAGAVGFRHSFLWDGYHMMKGYIADGRWDLALNILDNTAHQIDEFGYPLNGSAKFYVTRAQPDYFAHEVRALADRIGPRALVHYLPALEKVHTGYWMDGKDKLEDLPGDGKVHTHRSLIRMPDGSFLNRYWDDANGPRLESYKEDVDLAEVAVAGLTGVARKKAMKKVYKSLRLAAASGWDFSSRWFKDGKNLHTINTTDILPVDLNSLMAYNEETLGMAYEAAAETEGYNREYCLEKAAMYRDMARKRIDTINKYLWDPETKTYRDYDFVEGRQTEVLSAAMVYPLYVGIASTEQAFGVKDAVECHLLGPYGIGATNTKDSKEQWDGFNAWAPCNWAAPRGFARIAHLSIANNEGIDVEPLLAFAELIKNAYMRGTEMVFRTYGFIPEKLRNDNATILAGGGEYNMVKVLAMSAETYRALLKLKIRDTADHLPFGNRRLGGYIDV